MSRLAPAVSEVDHLAGPDDAAVTLVEYGDYECPACGIAQPVVREVRRLFGEDLRFAFRHFPLARIHPHAQRAAEAAEAAGAQGRFWPMHETLFDNQANLEDEALIYHASLLGLDARRVARELAAGTHTEPVRRHFLSGVRSGVNGTPTFFINGLRHDGSHDLSTLLGALEAAARQAIRPAAPEGRAAR